MNYVFYDLETTGRSSAWDQIIQIAAVLTDENLNIKEKFEEKCRINSSCIPNPEAILVNKISIRTLLSTNLSHYQLMINLQKKFTKWSPAIFIGYNSIKFDEEFLRNSFFKNLLNPYITIKEQNYRFDLLDSIRAINHLHPDRIKSLISEKGNPILKLDQIAPLNGISDFKAHDALGDTIATLGLAKIIKKKSPSIWKDTISNKTKSYLLSYISNKPFCYIESIFGRIKLFTLSYIGEHPYYKWAMCFDLNKDPSEVLNLNEAEFRSYLEQTPKVIKNIKLNKSPLFLSHEYVSSIREGNNLTDKEIIQRNKFILDNPSLKKKIVNYYEKKLSETISDYNQADIFAEESIYKKFLSDKDTKLMKEFHLSTWEDRNIIKRKFSDERLTYFANMLIYEENPEYLEKTAVKSIRRSLSDRLLSHNNEKWLTLYNAYKKIDDLREKCDNEKDDISLKALEEINEYLEKTEKQLQIYKG